MRLNPEAPSAQQRILDAAEACFARLGFYGTTIRNITDEADVPLSLARYHFGSKEQLFQQVLGRRAEETCRQLDESLAKALQIKAPQDRLEAVVAAMVSLSIDRLASGNVEWRHYLQLLSSLGSLNDKPELTRPFREPYTSTLARYRQALCDALPDATPAVVDWGLHFLQTLAGHAIHDTLTTRLLAGQEGAGADLRELQKHMVAHVVGGIRAQMNVC